MKRLFWIGLVIVLLSGVVDAAVVDPRLVAANNDFGVRLLKKLTAAERGKNVFISPASISLALSMTYNGADGSTRDAMAKTLGYQGLSLSQINAANSALLAGFSKPGAGVKLEIANSLWARKGVSFKPEFMAQNKRFYSAKLATLPFDSKAPGIINGWVSQQTQGKIRKIVQGITPNDILFLVNAVYFRGDWNYEFDRSGRDHLPFKLSNGKKKTVAMIHKTDDLSYISNRETAAVCLPYLNGRYGMWIILPHKTVRISDFAQHINARTLDVWCASTKVVSVDVHLPIFEIAYSADNLVDALTDMGMGVAFNPLADFSRLSSERAYITTANHTTTLCVNEEGTEATAATVMIAYTGDGVTIGPKPISFNVDHPFLCLIRDNKTKAILFIGAVEKP